MSQVSDIELLERNRRLMAAKAPKTQVTATATKLLDGKKNYKTKTGKSYDANKKPAGRAAPAIKKVPTSTASGDLALWEEVNKLDTAARDLKVAKAPMGKVAAAVNNLLEGKKEFKAKTGNDYDANKKPAGGAAPATSLATSGDLAEWEALTEQGSAVRYERLFYFELFMSLLFLSYFAYYIMLFRDLKAKKASNDEIMDAVGKLEESFKKVSGIDYDANKKPVGGADAPVHTASSAASCHMGLRDRKVCKLKTEKKVAKKRHVEEPSTSRETRELIQLSYDKTDESEPELHIDEGEDDIPLDTLLEQSPAAKKFKGLSPVNSQPASPSSCQPTVDDSNEMLSFLNSSNVVSTERSTEADRSGAIEKHRFGHSSFRNGRLLKKLESRTLSAAIKLTRTTVKNELTPVDYNRAVILSCKHGDLANMKEDDKAMRLLLKALSHLDDEGLDKIEAWPVNGYLPYYNELIGETSSKDSCYLASVPGDEDYEHPDALREASAPALEEDYEIVPRINVQQGSKFRLQSEANANFSKIAKKNRKFS
uniref:Glutamyl-prolyl-tRNA synthetase-like protein n=1 Tax=Oikopleura dioica TaxID=34765 RepID=Q66S27_OIKDI|nr:glutamyl-prolyl-tRNA synthetase-like protein [Oikopleura dioica]